jgi:hypothetical protein
MSRTTVVRRLTAVIALLAVFCLAAPATAAAAGSHRLKSPTISQVSLLDQFVLWLTSLGISPAPAGRPQIGSLTKSSSFVSSPPVLTGHTTDTTDASGGLDPNGHQ